ncbi:hypothetical protein MRX96_034763 [Rhipicephalus microplus]
MVPTTATGGTSSSLFGQKSSFVSGSGQTPSLFGQSLFGQSSAPAFGQPQAASTFGQQSQEQKQQGSSSTLFAVGGSGFLSGLGTKPAADASSKNVFGGPSSFTSAGQTATRHWSQVSSDYTALYTVAAGEAHAVSVHQLPRRFPTVREGSDDAGCMFEHCRYFPDSVTAVHDACGLSQRATRYVEVVSLRKPKERRSLWCVWALLPRLPRCSSGTRGGFDEFAGTLCANVCLNVGHDESPVKDG